MTDQVKLIWATPNAEELIVDMARVSNPTNQGKHDNDSKLIKYLIKHKHWSPFEMANLCVEINTTRGISPQILRHRSFTFQEFSQRYANTNSIGRIHCPQLRSQDLNNRQNSVDDLDSKLGKSQVADIKRRIAIHFEEAEHLYQELISKGVAKESARFLLPSAVPTRLYMNGTLRSWAHYIDLRSANGTQQEHKEIAVHCKQIFTEQFPIISSALWN
jgi:thymidylate synthase (FAD)